MKHLLILAMSGAFGTLIRYQVLQIFGERNFPWGTLTVNVVGSLLMGFAYVIIVERGVFDASLKPYVMTAFLGAFTTFSAFSLDVFRLIENGDVMSALSYIFASVLSCVLALTLAIFVSRALI